jgi:SAM-dependent methyltransferase
MMLSDSDFVCPKCRGTLGKEASSFSCQSCRRSFPIVHGIPDFRLRRAHSLWYSSTDDSSLQALAELFPKACYEELESELFASLDPFPDPFRTAYRQAAEQRGEEHWEEAVRLAETESIRRSSALEIGCGAGGALVTLAKRFDKTYGVDVSLEHLLLSRKRLEERGLGERAMVVAASADALPFRSDLFNFATAMNVIEHVDDQLAALSEIHRVLMEGDTFFFDSPNRFSLLLEPHVKVWGVGFLPRQWADGYVRLIKKGIGYQGTRLLSLFELRSLLRRTFGQDIRIGLPSLQERPYFQEGRVKKTLRNVWGLLENHRSVRQSLLPLVPTHHVLARKSCRLPVA